jgi:putative ABC transport system permease protein
MIDRIIQLWRRILFYLRRDKFDQELEEEMRFHLEMKKQENLRAGLEEKDARYAARRQFGNQTLLQEVSREMWGFGSLETFIQDLRYGARMFINKPGFTLIAVFTLALGIGANTAIFSIVRSVLIEPLPFAQPERLMQARLHSQATGEVDDWVSHCDVVDWQEQSRSFEGIGSYRYSILNFAEDGPPEANFGVSLSHQLLPMLGVSPAMGRYFLPEEDQPGHNNVIILSDELWRRRFSGRTDIIGQTIRASNQNYVVVGVMPPGFNFPLRLWTAVRLSSRQMGFWTPIGTDGRKANRSNANCNAILQLKPGVSEEEAQAELDSITAQLARDYPQTNAGRSARLVSLKDQTIGNTRGALLVVTGAVGLVLLIVCANLANLLLVRADGRRKEMAVRHAIGASRFRLARQSFTESLLLAFVGGAAGTAFAAWSLELLLKLSPQDIPRLAEARIDAGMLGFALALTILAGLFLGAVPAWRATRGNLYETLKGGAGQLSARQHSSFRTGNLLVSVEIALALALTLGAGLLLNSFVRLMGVDPGFRTNGVLSATIILPRTQYPDASSNVTFFRRVIEQLEATPGVESAGTSESLPMSGHVHAEPLKIEGNPLIEESNTSLLAVRHIVSANYLSTLDIPLVRGRLLTNEDRANTPAVAVVNETAAKRFWPDEDPIGKRISFGEWHQVVGIVRDTHLDRLDEPPLAEVYIPVEQSPTPSTFLVVRSDMTEASLTDAVRRAVAAIDPNQPIFFTIMIENMVADSVARQRFSLWLLGVFSTLALSLAALGVYGVVAYSVKQRTREIGIRRALGAHDIEVLKMVMKGGMKPVVIGLIAGIIIALVFNGVLSSLLYGVTATDPATLLSVIGLLILVALLACYVPARRAARVDPMVALRHE